MKLKQLLFCLLVLLDCITANAYDFDQNGIYYNITGDNTVEVTYVEDGDGNADFYSGSISIPRRISKDGVTYTVTAIGDKAFNHCSDVTSVTIPNTVTSIGNDAFSGCSNLATITIPESVTSIGEDAFWLTGLTSIAIPQSVISIGKRIIAHSRVSSIIVEEGNTKYDSRENCNAIIETETNTLIVGCSNTFIPNTVTTIGECAFERCPGLINMNIPNTITSIGKSAFYNCVSLTSVTLPNTIKSIGDYMFSFCYELASVNIPNSVTSIGVQAFERCYSLTKIEIPNSVTSIGQSAFDECDNLIMVKVDIDSPLTIDENTFRNRTNATLYVPAGCKDAYEDADYWTEFHEIVEMPGVGYEFTAAVPCNDGTANLTFKVTSTRPWEVEVSASPEDIVGALTIPATVQNEGGIEFAVRSIGDRVFRERTGITSLIIEEGVKTIGRWSFELCENIVSVTLPESVEKIVGAAFALNTKLQTINIPKNLKEIEDWVFRGTNELKSITLPEGLTSIWSNAFRESGLESIKFPTTLAEVGEDAFHSCSSLKTIDFNDASIRMNAQVFWGCTSLEDVYIPKNVKLIGWSFFRDCTSLKTVVFEAKEDNNGWEPVSLFFGCNALESVVVPFTSMMGNSWFNGCSSLKSVTFLRDDAPANNSRNYANNFQGVPDDVLFIIPEGTAENFLLRGYKNLSDKSGLPLVREEFEAEAARLATMADAATNGDKASLTAAVNAARSTVNSTDDYMTVYAQIAAIKTAAKTFMTTATLPENFDVTAATVTNPDFDRLDIGWKVPYIGDGNGYFVGEKSKYTNGDVTIDHFIEVWKQTPSNLSNGQIAQTIKKLPAGVYRLEADMIATLQSDASAEVTGVSLFAGNAKVAVATENEKPQHFSVKFENATTRDVTIGIDVNGTNANWVAMDNVRLIYESKAANLPQSADLKSSETDTLYLYNVDADKYLSAGHSWGTHAILDETGLPIRLTQNEETGLWQIYFWEGSADQKLLWQEDPEAANANNNKDTWVDYHGNRGCPWWIITQTTDGTLLIQNDEAEVGEYLGNDPEKQDYQDNDYKGVSYVDVNAYVTADKNVHWLFFSKSACDMIIAKRKLMDAILRMEATGMTDGATLFSTAKTVYENDDATIKEVIDITTLLNSQMGMPRLNEPIDMTALITNPRFENNTTEGWTGANVVGGRSDATSNHEQEFWNASFNMYQTITGVPNGRYRLKWKGFTRPGSCENVYAEYKAGTDNASAVVYANDVEKTMKNWALEPGDANTGDWSQDGEYYPNTMESARRCLDAGLYADELEVEVKDNVLTIGVKNTQLSPEHWVIFSDFELYIIENADQAYNKLTLPETIVALKESKKTVSVGMENREQIAGFQFMIKVPEGIIVNTNDDGTPKMKASSRLSGMTVSSRFNGHDVFVLVYGLGKYVKGTSGELLSVELSVPADVELTDDKLWITDVKLTTDKALTILPFDVAGTVIIGNQILGDANADGEVDVTDIITVANVILNRYVPSFDEYAADVNGDGKISVADFVGVADIVMDRLSSGNAQASAKSEPSVATGSQSFNELYIDPVTAVPGEPLVLSVRMRNEADIQGWQFDLVLPDGISIATSDETGLLVEMSDERTASARPDLFRKMLYEDGTTRLLCASSTGKAFTGADGEVARITVNVSKDLAPGNYPVSLRNIRLTDTSATCCGLIAEDAAILTVLGDATAIKSLEKSGSERIYDVQGRKFSHEEHLPAGVYIVNGKKVIKK